MTQKRTTIIAILLIGAAAFLAGYWPEHQKYLDTMGDLRLTDKQLTAAKGRERIYHLENMLLQALDHTARNEYKDAQALATEFFAEARADMGRPDMTKFTPDLKEILEKSEPINEALRREDPSSRDLLRDVMQQLARVAGPPTASEPPPIISVVPTPQN